MLKIELEQCDGEWFAHIWADRVLGHAAEVKAAIPKGTWVTMPPELHRLTPWMLKKCGFKFVAKVIHEHKVVDVLIKE